jgi:hypothetical protein
VLSFFFLMARKQKEKKRRQSWSPPEKKQILKDYPKFPPGQESIIWKGRKLALNTWKKWRTKKTRGESLRSVGGQRLVSVERVCALKARIESQSSINQNAPTRLEVVGLLAQGVVDTKADDGIAVLKPTTIERHTRKKYEVELGLNLNNLQSKPACRIEAEKDVRNAVSLAVLVNSIINQPDGPMHPRMIKNLDCTQLKIDLFGEKTPCLVPTKHMRECKQPAFRGETKKKVPFFSRLFTLQNAAGEVHPLVFVLIDEKIATKTIYKLEIPGLSPYPNGIGYIWLLHSFHGDDVVVFYKDYNTHIVIPAFEQSRQFLSDPKQHGLFSMDGDQDQIKAFLDEEEKLSQQFVTRDIEVLKYAASCSAIQQPNDVGPTHKALHQAISYATSTANSLINNDALETQITKIKANLSKTTPKKIWRLIKVVQPLLSAVFTSPNIIEGFQESGIWPYDPDRILFKVKGVKTFPIPLFTKIKSAILRLNEIFESEKVEEKVMDEYQIPKSEKQQAQEARVDLKQRDDLVTSRQRALILTHQSFFTKRALQRQRVDKQKEEKEKKKEEKEKKKEEKEKKKEEKAKEREAKKIASAQKRAEAEAKKKERAALKQKQKEKEEKERSRKKRPRTLRISKQTEQKKKKRTNSDVDDDFDISSQVVDENLNHKFSSKVTSLLGIGSKADLLASIVH